MKIGILGASGIARTVSPAFVQRLGLERYAVAARSLERAQAFAAEFGFEKAYGSYEALVEDPKVDLVYVTTPHSHHFACMKLCLEHGKPVLCEKAFTINAGQAREIRALAAQKHLFVAEALWTRYMPSRALIQRILDRGVIGKVHTLTANLSYPISHVERLTNPALAGGALLDVGVYGLNFALMHFGADIARIESTAVMTDTGVDGAHSITLVYRDGRMAVLTHGIYARSDRKGIIYGDKGYLVVENINNPQSVSVFDLNDRQLSYVPLPEQINGYEYEFIECRRALMDGRTESLSMPLDETIRVLEITDELRSQWGLVYPQEKA